MIDSIYTAMSGLKGHERGLSNISSNVANMNTPGFRGTRVDFVDVFNGGPQSDGGASGSRGLDGTRVSLDMRHGETSETGRDLDLAITGDAFFTLKDAGGTLNYSRNGGFEFDDKGVLVLRGTPMQVMGRNAAGELAAISLDGRRNSAPVATTKVTLSGNLSSTDTDHDIDDVAVYDALGGKHTLKLHFANDSTVPGQWKLTVNEGLTELASDTFMFTGGLATKSSVKLNLALTGVPAADVTFALDDNTTGYSSGTSSTLALKTQDGREAGQAQTLTFDEHGMLKIGYSNGDAAEGPKLVLADVRDSTGLVAAGEGVYRYVGSDAPQLGEAANGVRIASKTLELSNVDLTSEFSNLILMQRGYQAASQVLTTANEMLQQLLEVKGRR